MGLQSADSRCLVIGSRPPGQSPWRQQSPHDSLHEGRRETSHGSPQVRLALMLTRATTHRDRQRYRHGYAATNRRQRCARRRRQSGLPRRQSRNCSASRESLNKWSPRTTAPLDKPREPLVHPAPLTANHHRSRLPYVKLRLHDTQGCASGATGDAATSPQSGRSRRCPSFALLDIGGQINNTERPCSTLLCPLSIAVVLLSFLVCPPSALVGAS